MKAHVSYELEYMRAAKRYRHTYAAYTEGRASNTELHAAKRQMAHAIRALNRARNRNRVYH